MFDTFRDYEKILKRNETTTINNFLGELHK